MTDSILNVNLEADSKENVQRKPPPITTLYKRKMNHFLWQEKAAGEEAAHCSSSWWSPPDTRAPDADLIGEDGVPILLQKKATQRFS